MADTRTPPILGRVTLRLAARKSPRPTPAAHKYARAFMLRLARKLASSASQKRQQRRKLKRASAVLCPACQVLTKARVPAAEPAGQVLTNVKVPQDWETLLALEEVNTIAGLKAVLTKAKANGYTPEEGREMMNLARSLVQRADHQRQHAARTPSADNAGEGAA